MEKNSFHIRQISQIRSRRFKSIMLAVLVTAMITIVVKELRYSVISRNLRTVAHGAIFRGGRQRPIPLRRIIQSRKIKTVLSLVDVSEQEEQILHDEKVRWFSIVLEDKETRNSPDLLEQAAAILADPHNYPVYFHCFHGKNRSNMVQAVFRMKYCGWNLNETLRELGEYGFDFDDNGDHARGDFLDQYYQELILSAQHADHPWSVRVNSDRKLHRAKLR